MKNNRLVILLLRLLPAFSAVAILLSEIFLSDSTLPEKISASFMCGNYMYCFFPSSYEGRALSFWFAVSSLLLLFASFLSCAAAGCAEDALLVCGAVSGTAYALVRAVGKFSRIRMLFRNVAVWNNIEDYSRMFRLILCLLLSDILLSSPSIFTGPLAPFLLAAVSAALFAVQTFLVWRGGCLLISRKKELAIKAVINGNMRTEPPVSEDEDAKMSGMYARIVRYMEDRKPFLDDDFCIFDLAKSVYSNRTYISKVINYYSGRNFKQFVNYFRVKYSVELMKKDLRLSVMELATMSGFHSVVTYNLAFRLNMDDTPANYKKQINLGRL